MGRAHTVGVQVSFPGSVSRQTFSRQPCHDEHHHDSESIVTEAMVEIPHAGLELLWDFSELSGSGWLAGAVGVAALARGVQKLGQHSAHDKIEGAGSLALAAASALTAYDMIFAAHGHHAHHEHGLGAVGLLECAHGAAELLHGVLDFREAARGAGRKRWLTGLCGVVKGTSVIAAQCVPGAAVPLHVVHLGATIANAVLDPKH